MRVYITTYQRPEMLKQVVDHLATFGIEPIIKNDGVDFPHRGKKGFWKTWNEMLQDAQRHKTDLYLFTTDDVLDLDIERIKSIHKRFKSQPYVHNLINDGRLEQWVRKEPKQLDKDTMIVGFTDCAFFCNRKALDRLGYFVKEIPEKYFDKPIISSGVGRQLTIRLHNAKVTILMPIKSLGFHGDHKSVMHEEERKKNPLKSKH